MITIVKTSTTKKTGESVLFQPVLKAYPTCHSWIITAHLSLGHLEHHWKYFNRQIDKTHQLLLSLSHWPAAPAHLLSPLQVELNTINDMYDSGKPTILSVINLLNTDPSLDGSHMVILQPPMISVLNFLELHIMKLWQWRFCHDSSGSAKKWVDNFVPFLHHFSH